ncbi:MAG: hypothetical protein J7K72_00840 [Candidatus Aenigmarchaeota archaeon]|nr:hypothetical protein [Candidatus Aenigmarchaeota archaeon]
MDSYKDVSGLLEMSNTSEIYFEVIDPYNLNRLEFPKHKDIVKKRLDELREQNIKILGQITKNFTEEFCKKRKINERYFENYHDFKSTMFHEKIKQLGLNEHKRKAWERALRDEERRMRREKYPHLSRNNIYIKLHEPEGLDLMLFTGLKTQRSAIEKIVRKFIFNKYIVENKDEYADIGEEEKTEIVRNSSYLNDIARMKIIFLREIEKCDKDVKHVLNFFNQAGKNLGFDIYISETKSVPWQYHKLVLEKKQEEPADRISVHIVGLDGFMKDLFGRKCHEIYEVRRYAYILDEREKRKVYKLVYKAISRLA